MFERTRERIEDIKESPAYQRVMIHFEDNGKIYLGIGGGLVAGYLLHSQRAEVMIAPVTKNQAVMQYKPMANNIVVTNVVRRGHPGNIVKCVDTGEVFASQRRAAAAMGVPRYEMYEHLKGELETAGGHIFEKIGEAA